MGSQSLNQMGVLKGRNQAMTEGKLINISKQLPRAQKHIQKHIGVAKSIISQEASVIEAWEAYDMRKALEAWL
uniref:Uncharacterized protein n=1 Tax=Romanomermis culicivorax TaxID=13658 RepID=A0A915I2W4_ROMCU